MNYYEKHIGDYIRDTVSLTMLEDGAYGRMMDQVYQSERALPLDKKMVYRLARATSTAERKAVDFVLSTFFRETADGFVQKRIQSEIERYQEKQRKAKASADARWNRVKPDANASETHDAVAMRTHCEGNAHQTPDTKHQTPDPKHKDDDDRLPPRPQHGAAVDPTKRATEIATLLRAAGVTKVTAFHPDVAVTWAQNERVTDKLLADAVVLAKESKGDAPIPIAYLKPIVAELLNPPKAKPGKQREDSSWAQSDQGIVAKAQELGIRMLHRHTHYDIKVMCFDEIRKRKGGLPK